MGLERNPLIGGVDGNGNDWHTGLGKGGQKGLPLPPQRRPKKEPALVKRKGSPFRKTNWTVMETARPNTIGIMKKREKSVENKGL